jgi:hypothetical protein
MPRERPRANSHAIRCEFPLRDAAARAGSARRISAAQLIGI